MEWSPNLWSKKSPNYVRTRCVASTCQIRTLQHRTILRTTSTATTTVMSLAAHSTQSLISLQELVSNHLIEIHPLHSVRDSHRYRYRILIFLIYSHMRSLAYVLWIRPVKETLVLEVLQCMLTICTQLLVGNTLLSQNPLNKIRRPKPFIDGLNNGN